MSNLHPLEQAIDRTFAAATAAPQTVQIQEFWPQFEAAIAQLPLAEQLRLGAHLITHLAQLYELKAEWLLNAWEETYQPQEPLFSEAWLQGLVRQTQQVDISMFTEPRRHRRAAKVAKQAADSVAEAVDKTKVLAMIDQITAEEAAQQALMTAHDENVSAWIQAIATWMQQQQMTQIPLLELHRALQQPLVEIWLALLLGNYTLEQRGEFYAAASIRVQAPNASSL
ncbi:MAG: hypothetical protein ACTS3T_13590 [Almyronema sp.]